MARKQVPLRLDEAVYSALKTWAEQDMRSTNALIERLLRDALAQNGRLPRNVDKIPRRGRPPRSTETPDTFSGD